LPTPTSLVKDGICNIILQFWKATVRWDDLRCFIVVAEAGTLSAGAKRLGLSVATTGRRIDALEAALGLRLIDRSPNGAAVTAKGRRILAVVSAGADQLEQVARVAASLRQGDWSEPVRISATEPVVSEILAPAVPKLWSVDPSIRIQLRSSAEVASLSRREADIAIRLFPPTGDSLYVRKLPQLPISLYASRGYLRGRPPASIDLSAERLLCFDDTYGAIPETAWIEALGLGDQVVLRTGSTRALLKAAMAGAGIAPLPDLFAARETNLVRLPMAKPIPARTPWMVVHRDLRAVRQIRTVKTWIVRSFRQAHELLPAK
jgi:DNA-binding transcriptional LysR family regulator